MLGLKEKTILGLSTPSTFLRFCFCADTDDADTDDSGVICSAIMMKQHCLYATIGKSFE